MKKILFLFVVLTLSACRHGIPDSVPPADIASCSVGDIENSSLPTWLRVRECLCNLPLEQQYKEAVGPEPEKTKHQLLIALLASCSTSQLSLQIRASQQPIHLNPRWNVEKRAFLSLIDEQIQQVVKLQEENARLRLKLKNTIEGIHDIELEMNSLDSSTGVKE